MQKKYSSKMISTSHFAQKLPKKQEASKTSDGSYEELFSGLCTLFAFSDSGDYLVDIEKITIEAL